MKKHFPSFVERGRVRKGEWGTQRGDPFGFFHLEREGVAIRAMVSNGSDEIRWDHVSVSTPHRCPTWEEMEWVKRLFFRPQEVVMQLHVAEEEHISVHPYCLHMWRPHVETIPLPPKHTVA